MARGPQPTVQAREARVFAMLSEGKRHPDIAESVGLSVARVEQIASKFKAELSARAEATKDAAIDATLEARQIARDAAPDAMRCLVAEMRDADSSADRRAAAVALLDRAGVTVKSELVVKDERSSDETLALVATVVLGVKREGGE